MPRAGQYRYRVKIQSPSETNIGGDVVISWQDVTTVSASVQDPDGRELFLAQAVNSQVTTEVKMRWYSSLTAKHRLQVLRPGGAVWKTLNITSVTVNARRTETTCMCIETGA